MSEARIQHSPHTWICASLKLLRMFRQSLPEHWWTLTAEAIRLAFCYPHHVYLSLKPLFCLCLRYHPVLQVSRGKGITLNLMYFESKEHGHLCTCSDRLKPSHGSLLEMQTLKASCQTCCTRICTLIRCSKVTHAQEILKGTALNAFYQSKIMKP